MSNIQRGEVYDVMPNPSIGKEIQKKRPCVVVSANKFNALSGLSVVCPITEGKGMRADIIHIALRKGEGGCTKDSLVLCDQVKSVDEDRLVEKRGNVMVDVMQKIDIGLRQVLSL